MRYAIPLGIFAALVVVLAIGLKLDPRYVPSPLIGKPVPQFALPDLRQRETSPVDNGTLLGKPRLLNVWASWCVACRAEHPLLLELATSKTIEITGLNYKDERTDALAWLGRHGDPYGITIFDRAGRLGLDLGVYGVPETFVLDRNGIIRHKHVGPLNENAIEEIKILMNEIDGGS